ncbi:hypothetical protein F4780DRAFT_691518 [Xylariomycetidae sp. FL0641]|nr:hypothetical protein F4780DRAFT_691518 [Xylariomycetidae sp. FL0641]
MRKDHHLPSRHKGMSSRLSLSYLNDSPTVGCKQPWPAVKLDTYGQEKSWSRPARHRKSLVSRRRGRQISQHATRSFHQGRPAGATHITSRPPTTLLRRYKNGRHRHIDWLRSPNGSNPAPRGLFPYRPQFRLFFSRCPSSIHAPVRLAVSSWSCPSSTLQTGLTWIPWYVSYQLRRGQTAGPFLKMAARSHQPVVVRLRLLVCIGGLLRPWMLDSQPGALLSGSPPP